MNNPAPALPHRGSTAFLGRSVTEHHQQNPVWALGSPSHFDPMPTSRPTDAHLSDSLRTRYEHLRGEYPETYKRLVQNMLEQGGPPSQVELFRHGGDDHNKLKLNKSSNLWAGDTKGHYSSLGAVGARSLSTPSIHTSARTHSSGGRSRGKSSEHSSTSSSRRQKEEQQIVHTMRLAKSLPRDPWFGNLRINPDVYEKV